MAPKKSEIEETTEELESSETESTEAEEAEDTDAESTGAESTEGADDDAEAKGTDTDVPFWLQDEDEEADKSSFETVPVAAIVKLKSKLKGKLKESNDEVERLKEELRLLKAQGNASAALTPPKRPRVADFDGDDEAYEAAMDKYEEEKLIYQKQVLRTEQDQTQQIKQQEQAVAKAVDAHYERANKLVQDFGVSTEVYQQADQNVKEAIEAVMPDAGETVFNQFISLIGDGSEKTMFYAGKNKAAQAELKSLLAEDKSGLKAMFYLGKISERINGTKTQQSRARKPAPQHRGDARASTQGGALKRKWDAAHAKGNTQEAYNIKQQAKKAGVNTNEWS